LSARLPIHVVRRAAGEIIEASHWWNQDRPAAPGGIRQELERAFDLIASHPEVGAQALNARLPDVRRVYLARIGYHLYYRVTSSAVEVLSFWHSSRGSGPHL